MCHLIEFENNVSVAGEDFKLLNMHKMVRQTNKENGENLVI